MPTPELSPRPRNCDLPGLTRINIIPFDRVARVYLLFQNMGLLKMTRVSLRGLVNRFYRPIKKKKKRGERKEAEKKLKTWNASRYHYHKSRSNLQLEIGATRTGFQTFFFLPTPRSIIVSYCQRRFFMQSVCFITRKISRDKLSNVVSGTKNEKKKPLRMVKNRTIFPC